MLCMIVGNVTIILILFGRRSGYPLASTQARGGTMCALLSPWAGFVFVLLRLALSQHSQYLRHGDDGVGA